MTSGNLTDRSSSATSATSRSARGKASRQAILDAAVEVVATRGLAAATVGEVARAAGTSKATVLYHFGRQERLLRAVAEQALGHFHDTVYRAARVQGGPEAAVAALFSRENRPRLLAAREMMGLGQRDPVIGREVQRGFEHLARMVAVLLGSSESDGSAGPAGSPPGDGPPAGDADEVLARARALVLGVHGHVELWLCSGEEDPTPFRDGALRVALALGRAPAP